MPSILGNFTYLEDSSNTSASQSPDHPNIFLIPYLSHFLHTLNPMVPNHTLLLKHMYVKSPHPLTTPPSL